MNDGPETLACKRQHPCQENAYVFCSQSTVGLESEGEPGEDEQGLYACTDP
jgi:hypothetical protein